MKTNVRAATAKGDDPEDRKREQVGECRDRNHRQKQGAPEIGADQQWSPSHAIDPDTGDETEEQIRQLTGEDECRHLGGGRMEHQRGGQWDRGSRDRASQPGNGLREPETQERRVAPQARRFDECRWFRLDGIRCMGDRAHENLRLERKIAGDGI